MATLRTFRNRRGVGMGQAFVGVITDDPEGFAYRIKAKVAETTGLSCAVGIGDTRLLAKTATRAAKPGGVARLTRRDWIPTMGAKPVTEIWGIGTRTAARLGELGIVTVEDLARADHDELARHFGPSIGPHLRVLGLGGDDTPIVDEPHVARGRSKEETFTTDVADPEVVAAHVERLARAVTTMSSPRPSSHHASRSRCASNFFTRRRSASCGSDDRPDEVAGMASTVLARFGELRPVASSAFVSSSRCLRRGRGRSSAGRQGARRGRLHRRCRSRSRRNRS
jgi:DNA polymerase-4